MIYCLCAKYSLKGLHIIKSTKNVTYFSSLTPPKLKYFAESSTHTYLIPPLPLENNLQDTMKMIILSYKNFLFVRQVISASYYPPLYLLNKSCMNVGVIEIKRREIRIIRMFTIGLISSEILYHQQSTYSATHVLSTLSEIDKNFLWNFIKVKKAQKNWEKVIFLLKLQPTTAKNHFLQAFMSKNWVWCYLCFNISGLLLLAFYRQNKRPT